ncbi:MAG: hypothetical protein BA864_15640 [Desulfuromonadales bacterium C00003093]|nr:MAG: hypothetical protein BA864_15640 [Desulfuromonadales bacterium C00003093]
MGARQVFIWESLAETMDLADIRKKAQQQTTFKEEQALVDPAVSNEVFEALAAGAAASAASAQTHEYESVAGLQQYFPDMQFASEEDYIQGLSGTDSRADIETSQWLTFLLNDEEYALSLDVVMELIKPRTYTELPDVPDYLRGILSLRGEVVPVIDLRLRLNLGEGEETGLQRIIVCEGAEQSIGLLVDRITQVVRFAQADVEPAPLILRESEKAFVSGVGRYQGRMLILLNPDETLQLNV